MAEHDRGTPGGSVTRQTDSQEERRISALTAFLDERVTEGYRIETRTDTHAIIAQDHRAHTFLDRLLKRKVSERQVISVDSDGVVTTRPAEPLRS
jgi:hypothetical protein